MMIDFQTMPTREENEKSPVQMSRQIPHRYLRFQFPGQGSRWRRKQKTCRRSVKGHLLEAMSLLLASLVKAAFPLSAAVSLLAVAVRRRAAQ